MSALLDRRIMQLATPMQWWRVVIVCVDIRTLPVTTIAVHTNGIPSLLGNITTHCTAHDITDWNDVLIWVFSFYSNIKHVHHLFIAIVIACVNRKTSTLMVWFVVDLSRHVISNFNRNSAYVSLHTTYRATLSCAIIEQLFYTGIPMHRTPLYNGSFGTSYRAKHFVILWYTGRSI